MQILFVCTGNTCRSPMAELYFNYCRIKSGKSACGKSCGISTSNGLNMSTNAEKVMQKLGIDTKNFKSHQADYSMLKDAGMIFTMTGSHRDILKAYFPEFSGKISTLLDGDVSDPYGMDENTYMQTFNMMKDKIEKIAMSLD